MDQLSEDTDAGELLQTTQTVTIISVFTSLGLTLQQNLIKHDLGCTNPRPDILNKILAKNPQEKSWSLNVDQEHL